MVLLLQGEWDEWLDVRACAALPWHCSVLVLPDSFAGCLLVGAPEKYLCPTLVLPFVFSTHLCSSLPSCTAMVWERTGGLGFFVCVCVSFVPQHRIQFYI